MLLDLSLLRRHRDFRWLFFGQFVSAFGSFLTYVALPVQIYELTHQSWIVGLLGSVQLVPLALAALWGGAVADAIDRRRLLLWSELLLAAMSLLLAGNALLPQPSVVAVFVIAGLQSAATAFHRPALEALTPKLVDAADLPAVSALSALRGTAAAIGGPAVASVLVHAVGLAAVYAIDAATFAAALGAVAAIRAMPPPAGAPAAGLASIAAGLRYAKSRPELIGTYVVDIVAMTFAMPMALFPELAATLHAPDGAGYLFSALSAGSLLITLASGWTRRVHRHGAAIVVAAALWGVAIVPLGGAGSMAAAAFWLALAGAADTVSALFRMTVWNETIPSELRGRMASLEQLSYMSGPLLGNVRAGFMAGWLGLGPSIATGGVLCVLGVLACVPLLPAFWRYRRATGGDSPGGSPS